MLIMYLCLSCTHVNYLLHVNHVLGPLLETGGGGHGHGYGTALVLLAYVPFTLSAHLPLVLRAHPRVVLGAHLLLSVYL